MLEKYYELKIKYLDYVLLFKKGKFYYCYKDDAYIIHYFMRYKLNDDVVSFSKEALDRVLKILGSNDIGYIIVDKIVLDKCYGDSEKYSYFYNLSLEYLGKETVIRDINKRLENYTLDKLINLVSTI